jgi:hypothetical protein
MWFRTADLRRFSGLGFWRTSAGSSIQELLLQVEYLIAENRMLRAHLPDHLRLTNEERSTLAEISKRLGRKGLEGCYCRRTGNDSGLVLKARCSEVRWLQVPLVSRDAGYQPRSGASDRSPCSRGLQVGLRSHLRRGYPSSATKSQIRQSATFSAGTASHLLPSEAKPPHGRTSSPHIWG